MKHSILNKTTKSIVTILILTICLFFSVDAFSQQTSIEVEVEIQDANSKKDIIVSINNGSPDYRYFLYDHEPWKKGTLLETSNSTNNDTYKFAKLKAGRYYVGAIDNAGNSKFVEVIIEENSN